MTQDGTGDATMNGGRLKRVAPHVCNEEAFCFTDGVGITDRDINRQSAFHKQQGKLVTVAAVQPPGRYGALKMGSGAAVQAFVEKPDGDGAWISGGFFVLSPRCIDYIEGDASSWESEPLGSIAAAGQLMAFEHPGFWHAMATLRHTNHLEALEPSRHAPWKACAP